MVSHLFNKLLYVYDLKHKIIDISQSSEPPSGQLRLATPATINFTASLFTSLAQQFPSNLVSTGGDEFNEECYVQDPQTQADLQASGQTLEQALGTFVRTMQGVLQKEGKTPVVWEGTFDTYMPGISFTPCVRFDRNGA